MKDESKKELLNAAARTVQAVIFKKTLPEFKTSDEELNLHCGCFVTLKNGTQLRGCLGQFTSDKPLIELVVEMAQASATSDPRFFDDPITAKEIDELDLEISVLSPLKRTNDPLSLHLGTDGIYIKKGWASGCFLPQVATETGWSKEEFLSYCCGHKAGLPSNAWQDPQTEVYLFTAEVFGRKLKEL